MTPLAGGPTIARKIRINRCDDGSERCSAFGACEVRRRAWLGPQSHQPGTPPLQQTEFRFAALRVKDSRAAALEEWRQLFAA